MWYGSLGDKSYIFSKWQIAVSVQSKGDIASAVTHDQNRSAIIPTSCSRTSHYIEINIRARCAQQSSCEHVLFNGHLVSSQVSSIRCRDIETLTLIFRRVVKKWVFFMADSQIVCMVSSILITWYVIAIWSIFFGYSHLSQCLFPPDSKNPSHKDINAAPGTPKVRWPPPWSHFKSLCSLIGSATINGN